jgi:transposase
MRKRIYVRPLTEEEERTVKAGLRSSQAFQMRRSQIVSASQRGQAVLEISQTIGCSEQCVRNAIHAFDTQGIEALLQGSSRPHTIRRKVTQEQAKAIAELAHHSPRDSDKPTSVWTLALLIQVSREKGILTESITGEALRQGLLRLGIRWSRIKHWITSPDRHYTQKKNNRDRLIALAATHPRWMLGFLDEVWWSRESLPQMHAWMPENAPLRLREREVPQSDPDPIAQAAYGILFRKKDHPDLEQDDLWLRFLDGRPVSEATMAFLEWVCQRLSLLKKTALLLVWDNASWHLSHRMRQWITDHNHLVYTEQAGVRIVVCGLPSKSPWLNPIEPKWYHGKRHVIESSSLLSASELRARVYDHYLCEHLPSLGIPQKVS